MYWKLSWKIQPGSMKLYHWSRSEKCSCIMKTHIVLRLCFCQAGQWSQALPRNETDTFCHRGGWARSLREPQDRQAETTSTPRNKASPHPGRVSSPTDPDTGTELGPWSIQGVQPGVPAGEHQGQGWLWREFKVQSGNRAVYSVGSRASQEGSQQIHTARDRNGRKSTQARMGCPDLRLNRQGVNGSPKEAGQGSYSLYKTQISPLIYLQREVSYRSPLSSKGPIYWLWH